MIDYIIVGSGLAGISFAEIALKASKSILVFDNNSQPSSRIAGGLYNPVVLKRFSEVWKAKEQLEFAFPLYEDIQEKFSWFSVERYICFLFQTKPFIIFSSVVLFIADTTISLTSESVGLRLNVCLYSQPLSLFSSSFQKPKNNIHLERPVRTRQSCRCFVP
jgi:hypothetical protein